MRGRIRTHVVDAKCALCTFSNFRFDRKSVTRAYKQTYRVIHSQYI